MFIETVTPNDATGETAAVYAEEVASMGRVMEATQCWSARPDILIPVQKLLHQIRDGFSLGLLNFRLITFVAAQHMPSSYCSHVYFRSLSNMMGREQALALREDYRTAGLTDQQVGMLAYAEQISRDASKVSEADILKLRALGLTDLNIADIALAASFRSFMSRYFDAVGATVEDAFLDDDPVVRDALAVGRKPSPAL